MHGRGVVKLIALCACLLARPVTAADPPSRSFVFGVMPYHSARVIIDQHRPVALFLREDLQLKDAQLETANGFKAFYEASRRGDYDLVAIAAHFARLLQREHGFVPLVRYATGGRCSIMVRSNSGIRGLGELAGRQLATPDRLALGTIVCLDALRRAGLQEGRDYVAQDMSTFNSAALAVIHGDAAAAVSAPAALMQMTAEQRQQLRMISDSDPYTNLVYLVHPRVPAALREQLRLGLLRFAGEPAGRAFFANTGFGGFLPVEPETMQAMDIYLNETRRLLGEARR
jgi:ABC-type phosphate/phosphonate transport system substrate-binding protein